MAWSNSVQLIVHRSKEQLQRVLRGANTTPQAINTQTECTLLVRHAIWETLLDIHPETKELHLGSLGSATEKGFLVDGT